MAIGTIIAAAVIPAYFLINVEHSAVSADGACNVLNDAPVWIPNGTTFITTTEMWFNSDGTGTVPAGWYSDTIGVREGNGADVFTAYVPCLTFYQRPFRFSAFDQPTACGLPGPTTSAWVDGANISESTKMYTDATLTVLVPASGWYMDDLEGNYVRQWDGSSFVGAAGNCTPLPSASLAVGADHTLACAEVFQVTHYYNLGATLMTATKLWLDPAGTIAPGASWYSDSVNGREWDGSAFLGGGGLCP
jgi:hypothetical protein